MYSIDGLKVPYQYKVHTSSSISPECMDEMCYGYLHIYKYVSITPYLNLVLHAQFKESMSPFSKCNGNTKEC